MPMQPLDIQKTRFALKMRGYDPVEVENFLALVAEDLTQRLGEIERLERDNRSLRERVANSELREHQLHDAILRGKKVSDEMISTSQREAQMLVREAEMTAERMVGQAGAVGQQMVDRDAPGVVAAGTQQRQRLRRQVTLDGVRRGKIAARLQSQDRCRGEDLGHRGGAEGGVRGQGPQRGAVGHTGTARPRQARALVEHLHHDAGHLRMFRGEAAQAHAQRVHDRGAAFGGRVLAAAAAGQHGEGEQGKAGQSAGRAAREYLLG